MYNGLVNVAWSVVYTEYLVQDNMCAFSGNPLYYTRHVAIVVYYVVKGKGRKVTRCRKTDFFSV